MINTAFSAADSTWYYVWQKTRLGHVIEAEDFHFLPQFMVQDDVFPDEIYYTVTPAQRRAYMKRWRERDEEYQLDGFEAFEEEEKVEENENWFGKNVGPDGKHANNYASQHKT
ncbi:hypothetical protein BGZ58_010802 [Dissophora ornata]|nr:hypothetical protein BGZ58_010802 [Dissophora ornata]